MVNGTSDVAAQDEDWDAWPRRIYEALRPIDPRALFWVDPLEVDLRDAEGYELEQSPFEELRAWMDDWLDRLNPNGAPDERVWSGHGVRLRFQARGRRHPDAIGWTATPPLTVLEQRMNKLHLVDGGTRDFIGLDRAEVRGLAAGEQRVVGQGTSYQETFISLGEEMDLHGSERVGDLHPSIIETFAGMLGLVDVPPSMGNFEQAWRNIHGIPPDE